MNSPIRLVLVAIVCFYCRSASAEWVLDVTPRWVAKEGWSLNLTVRRTGQGPLQTYASDLPWGTRDKLVLVAIPIGEDAEPLRAAHYIDDPRQDPITIKPKDRLEGRVLLDKRFAELSRVNDQSSVGLCYRYAFSKLQRGSKEVAEGCMLLPRHSR
jgi:hypothetical protein